MKSAPGTSLIILAWEPVGVGFEIFTAVIEERHLLGCGAVCIFALLFSVLISANIPGSRYFPP
jgi:hypothetical protein